MTLDEFLRREASLPPYPGACCVMADRWFETVRGYSALGRYGREIRTDEDVQLWLSEPGGIAVGVNRVMRSCGVAKTTKPTVGDVGLVATGEALDGRLPLTMAIRGRRGWHSRNSGGLLMMTDEALWKAWAI